MSKVIFFLTFSFLNIGFMSSQSVSEFEKLLKQIGTTEKSHKIYKTKGAKKITSFGKKSLPILATFFTDTTSTKVYSKCFGQSSYNGKRKLVNVNGYLSIGEISILIAHHIEYMDLMKIMGTYSCAPFYCKKFNSVESDLSFINEYGIDKFKSKYLIWLSSEKRKENLFRLPNTNR